jgi:CDP-glucose 4,6-dehydratase
MGTVNLLESVRRAARPCVVVIVTTDKVYEEADGTYACRETDPLGGSDPYSASKACAEIVTSSYARSFFRTEQGSAVRIATARAGNVIGGGDYAADRLIPDLVRSIEGKKALQLRNPGAIRPWQHVLEPLSGYLWLATCLDGAEGHLHAEPWNFGPSSDGFRTVMEIATRATRVLGGHPIAVVDADTQRREMPSLTLSTDKARRRLRWAPVWDIDRAVDETMEWYRATRAGGDAHEATLKQITRYTKDAELGHAPWATEERTA